MPRAAALAAVAVAACACACACAAHVQDLRPGVQLRGELIRLDEETKWYKPVGLVPGANYEVSVSYPASLPAAVDVRLERVVRAGAGAGGGVGGGSEGQGEEEDEEAAAGEEDGLLKRRHASSRRRSAARLRRRRQLLDLEKASFRAGEGGAPVIVVGEGEEEAAAAAAPTAAATAADVLIAVRARRRSPRAPSAGPGPEALPYNVRLCRAYLRGALPADALAPAGALAGLLLLVAVARAAAAARWPRVGERGVFGLLLDWVVAGKVPDAAAAGRRGRRR